MSAVAEYVVTSDMAEKVHRLLDEGRVCLVQGFENRAAVVNGETGWYTVRCYSDRIECDCQAGNAPWCSHRLAAAVVFAESAARVRDFGW